jgi:hypothetical protein
MQQKPPRPTGVTVLAVLSILGGLGGLALGGILLAAAAIVNTLNLTTSYPQLAAYNLTTGTIAAILGIFGAVILILGILDLVLGIGFLGGKGWAWSLAMIVGVINIVFAIPSIYFFGAGEVFSLIIWIIILYYLTRTHVKAFFGKGSGAMPSTGGMMSAAPIGSTSSSSMGGMIKCRACGAMAPAGSTKCPSCGAML